MANTYLYGAYGHLGDSVAQSAIQAGTVPIYVGTAPVNLVRGYKENNLVNFPVKASNLSEAQRVGGYSDAWESYTLCEVFTAHFDNPVGNIGPIYFVNVLDPDVHRTPEAVTKDLAFVNGRAEFRSDKIILDTFLLDGKMEDIDFILDYNYTKNSVIISSMDSSAPLTGTLTASYYEVMPDVIEADDIIGGETANGEYSGFSVIKLLYKEHSQVANLIAAPGWSHIPEVYNAMVVACQKINGHWEAFCVGDIPLADASGEIDTIQKAYTWARQKGYGSERSKVYWPQGIDNTGRVFHLSTLGMVELMRADFSHDSVPMETCGNKDISIIRQYFGPNSKNRGFDQQQANELTQRGISTAVFWGGRWVLWGNHTAGYEYGADGDPRAIFDVNIRMLLHIVNSFQREWGITIDEPMTLQLRDRIINREQEKLDGLVAMGALLGEPRILFLESNNSTTDLMNGDFRWDIAATPTPPFKSGTVYVSYTDAGFAAYFATEEAA